MSKFQVNIILEVLGRPKEHVKGALNELVTRLDSEKEVKIIEKNLHDPLPVESAKDLFTTFAELTLELESLNTLFGLIFAYMPANIEVISPQKINLSNIELNDLGNRLVQRLHDYDAITKKALYENELLMEKLKGNKEK